MKKVAERNIWTQKNVGGIPCLRVFGCGAVGSHCPSVIPIYAATPPSPFPFAIHGVSVCRRTGHGSSWIGVWVPIRPVLSSFVMSIEVHRKCSLSIRTKRLLCSVVRHMFPVVGISAPDTTLWPWDGRAHTVSSYPNSGLCGRPPVPETESLPWLLSSSCGLTQ
jgi:hypothetical protein